MQAALFRRLREHYQKRDRLRLIVDYRKKYLDSLVRGGDEEAKQAEENYEQARTQTDKDYEETAAAVAEKKRIDGGRGSGIDAAVEEAGEAVSSRPFRARAGQAGDLHKLTSAINRAKDGGDIQTLREIAEDPHGFILRQGWTSLDFSDEVELAQLRRLHETLQLEIITVIESLDQLRKAPNTSFASIVEQRPGVLEELAAERTKSAGKGKRGIAK